MINFRCAGMTLAAILATAAPAFATGCDAWPQFSSNDPYLEPLSVPAKDVGEHLSDWEWSEGMQFTSRLHGSELWLDITHFPGNTTAAGVSRSVMHLGRVADEDFATLVLAEGDTGLFSISEPELRAIGCQFIWGKEGGQNPIALLRELYKALRHYETGAPLSSGFTGHLLGDSTLALELNNKIVLPQWAMSAVN
ncbi:hypothetical protein [Leisingera caerulea]|uniref:hypothetical protein n=1 Tax=Leisingera caerulea TaxID=506591 RepID=UPI0012B67012|nr:hypothetical protein [Leisingera caerulea]